ncbi:MAG: hypothetical protein MJK04_16815 [Psychrosphaera sp.]|nr:hypothetical protein [Psychrosphaera sp.]
MKYDDASWHFGGDYPSDLTQDNAYTHIGVFLTWALMNDLAGELHNEECPEDVEALKQRKMTGVEFLQKNCDGKFTDEDLNEVGNEFTSLIYDDYMEFYLDILDPQDECESVYHIANTWQNYDKVAAVITHLFEKTMNKR